MRDILGMAAAVTTAARSGLLAGLVDGTPRTAAEHARACKLDPRATALVLDVLVAYDLATRTDDRFTAAPAVVAAIARAPGGTERTLAMWAHLPGFLRDGAPLVRMDDGREEAYAGVVGALGRMNASSAAELASRCGVAPKRVLDIGCGSGVWSLAFRDAHVTGLDLPAVLETFRAFAGDREVATIAGDIHSVAIPRAFDLVVIANVLRIEAPDRARAIVQRAAAALEPGGAVLVVDALAGGTPAHEQARTVYALHLGMRTAHGRVYSRAEIGGWLAEAGLRQQRTIELADGPCAAILAQ